MTAGQPNPPINIDEGSNPPVTTTLPDEILRHSISDEELDMICDNDSDKAFNLMLTMVGGALATAASAISSLLRFFDPIEETVSSKSVGEAINSSLDKIDFVNLVIFSFHYYPLQDLLTSLEVHSVVEND